MRSTNTEALQAIRQLHDTDTGRLRGICLRHRPRDLAPPLFLGTPQPWRDELIAALDTDQRTVDSPYYLVICDRMPIVWLNLRGQVIVPDYPVSGIRARHQHTAAVALGDLARWALRDLADLRAQLDADADTPEGEYGQLPDGALRIASTREPTATRWITIGADLAAARSRVAQLCPPDELVVVTALGYGCYGRERHRLQLPVLCAMQQVATTHQVSLGTVGNWLAVQEPTGVDLDPQQVVDRFADAYLGPYPSTHAYTAHRMAELGWTQAITAAGIPERYLDTRAINQELFAHYVQEIQPGEGRHIEVFRRRPPGH